MSRAAAAMIDGGTLLAWLADMADALDEGPGPGYLLERLAAQGLCSTYLLGDQTWTGIGLVVLSAVVMVVWMGRAFRAGSAEGAA